MQYNFGIGYIVSQLNVASQLHIKSINIRGCSCINLELLRLLYNYGVIRGFSIKGDDKIKVYLKYYQSKSIFTKIKLVSTPVKEFIEV